MSSKISGETCLNVVIFLGVNDSVRLIIFGLIVPGDRNECVYSHDQNNNHELSYRFQGETSHCKSSCRKENLAGR